MLGRCVHPLSCPCLPILVHGPIHGPIHMHAPASLIPCTSVVASGALSAVERSINLAYSAIETFPEAKFHITNELIHNPTVNGHLRKKDVNCIEKVGSLRCSPRPALRVTRLVPSLPSTL